MNRDIKFRAWDKVHKRMIIVCSLNQYYAGTYFPDAIGHELEILVKSTGFYVGRPDVFIKFDLNDVELLQFTGQLDISNHEIYEGHRVMGFYKNRKGRTTKERPGTVVFNSGGFAVQYDDEPKSYYSLIYSRVSLKITGHIFESEVDIAPGWEIARPAIEQALGTYTNELVRDQATSVIDALNRDYPKKN